VGVSPAGTRGIEERMYRDKGNMKIQRIYIDTSVIGGCLDAKFESWSNGLFMDFRDGKFTPVIFVITAFEIRRGAPAEVFNKYAELLRYGSEILEITMEMRELADLYLRREILTPKFIEDALHIAAATIAEVDILVSWNFRHIVHYDKIRQFNGVNIDKGYKPVQIFSPMEVTSYGK
jgi:predicted nucleic acid-binding protein